MQKSFQTILLILTIPLLILSCQQGDSNAQSEQSQSSNSPRIITLSGFLTELVFELGYGDQIVGRDVTSVYPKQVNNIKDLGHISQLNIEAVLQLNPDFLLLEKKQLQQIPSLEQLKNAGIKVISVPTGHHLNNAVSAASFIKMSMEIDDSIIKKMDQQITQDSTQLVDFLKVKQDQPKVLFIYARGAGKIMVAGKNTAAAAIIEKAGGQNAIQSFDNYQAMTAESLIESTPDVILMFKMGIERLNGKEGLSQIPGIAQTAAFKNDRIIAMDGQYLTSFGPRAGKAALELAEKIHQNPNGQSL